MKPVAILLPVLLLTGCATAPIEPVVRTVTVQVPVAIPCVPSNVQKEPAYSDTNDALKTAPDAAERYQLLIIGRQQRMARLSEIEPVIRECKG